MATLSCKFVGYIFYFGRFCHRILKCAIISENIIYYKYTSFTPDSMLHNVRYYYYYDIIRYEQMAPPEKCNAQQTAEAAPAGPDARQKNIHIPTPNYDRKKRFTEDLNPPIEPDSNTPASREFHNRTVPGTKQRANCEVRQRTGARARSWVARDSLVTLTK